jgi:arylsulfatase A-like enzyme/Flp pilus assembly protein TadD
MYRGLAPGQRCQTRGIHKKQVRPAVVLEINHFAPNPSRSFEARANPVRVATSVKQLLPAVVVRRREKEKREIESRCRKVGRYGARPATVNQRLTGAQHRPILHDRVRFARGRGHQGKTMWRKLVIASCLIVGALAGLFFWAWPRQRANLLLITLDTTRADRLGCYGHQQARTPVLDELARNGIVWDNAATVAPLTLPAHASLFTGRYPAENGVRANGRGCLDESIPTLARVLKKQGYQTAAFVASFVLDRQFGLAQGFDTYDDEFAGETPRAGVPGGWERGAAAVVDAALEWLDTKPPGPFFVWVHCYDAHRPYFSHTDVLGGEFVERPYDGEIAYVDRCLGRLLDHLKDHDLESGTLVVIVGDHGEGLGDHDEMTHGFALYNTTMRIPLILRHPGRLPSGRRVDTPISLVDVSPTVLDLLGIRDSRKVTGRVMTPALLGRECPPAALYGATDEPLLQYNWSPLQCLTESGWKYIRSTRAELYNLNEDPFERHDLAAIDEIRTQQMERRLGEFESKLASRPEVEIVLSAAARQALISLGYTAGVPAQASRSPPAQLPDVKDMLPFARREYEAADLLDKGASEEGVRLLRDIIRQAPALSSAYLRLADALHDRSEFDEVAEVLHQLLEIQPDSAEGHFKLGKLLLEQGRLDDALRELVRTVELSPAEVEVHYYLGRALEEKGHPVEALEHYSSVLQIDHRHVAAYRLRANLLIAQGRSSEALADLKTALHYAPESAETNCHLGVALANSGNAAEARRHLERSVSLDPESAECHYSLGAFLVRERQFAEGIEHLSRALELQPDYPAARQRIESARLHLQQQPTAE